MMETEKIEGVASGAEEPTATAITSKVTVTATQDCNVLIDDVSVALSAGETALMTQEEAAAYANLGLVEVGAGPKSGEQPAPAVPRKRN
jgi:hypothetical protein